MEDSKWVWQTVGDAHVTSKILSPFATFGGMLITIAYHVLDLDVILCVCVLDE